MTRKAVRKRLQQQAKHRRSSERSSPPWMVMGAIVAATAFAAAQPAPASAADLDAASASGRSHGRHAAVGSLDAGGALRDFRLALVDEALRPHLPLPYAAIVADRADAAVTAQDEPARRFDIPAGPLDTALRLFEATTGVRVALATDSIRPIHSPGVSGSFTAGQAMELLLVGTNVAFRFTGPAALTLEFRIDSESVEVTAPAAATIVSSPKYTTSLRDTPQTIEVIPQAVMEAQGARTLSEALRNVPGISLQAGEGGGASNTAGDMFNMRGFSANNSIFVDGVRDDGLIARDVFNLEQVEVFMGPTGADVGRGNAAGYINMETKTPRPDAAYVASYGYGTADQKRLTVDVNHAMPIGVAGGWLSKTAVRLNGLWQDGGVPGRDIVELKSQAIAPSLAMGLGSPTRVFLGAQIIRQDNVPDYGVPGSAWLATPLAPTTVRAPGPVDQSNYYGSVGYDYDKGAQDSYTGRVEHDVNRNITWRNQTRYNKTSREAVITSIASPASYAPATNLVTLSRQGNDRENEILSNQTSAVARFSTGTLRHASSAGLEFTSEQQFAPTLGGVGTRAPADIFTPNPFDPVMGYAVVRTGAFNKGQTNTVALYGFDTVALGAKWQLNGGLRWEHYDATYRVVDATGVATTDARATDGLFSGKAGLMYKVTDAGNVYLSYGSTKTPPGTANFTLSAQANNQNNPNVKPQSSTNLEVGSKWGFFRNRLSFVTALFQTRNKNVIFTVDATAVPPIYNQDDSQRVNGVTMGASGQLTEHWQVLGNFAYLDATLDTQNSVNNGNSLTLTPKRSGNLWSTYKTPIDLTIGGGIRYTDSVYINAANTIQAPAYGLVDGLAEYQVNTHLTLRLNIYNLTGNSYIRNVNNNGGRYNPGNPRSATFTSSLKF